MTEKKINAKITMMGPHSWKKVRKKMVDRLKAAKTEAEFAEVILLISFGVSSSEEEVQAKRRFLGMDEL